MFYGISWTHYLECLGILLLAYYLVTCIIIFRTEMLSLFNRATGRVWEADERRYPPDKEDNASLIIREIGPLFKRNINKEELSYSLRTKLTRYNQWDEPGFREKINAFILGESEKKCSIHLGEEELRALWI
jgi:hypothetical protein